MSDGRSARRFVIRSKGRLRTGSGQAIDVVLHDISQTGCKLRDSSAALREGMAVRLWIGSVGPFDAAVQWRSATEAGLEFSQPLYEPVFDHLCATLG